MTTEPEVTEWSGDGIMGLRYSLSKGPVSIEVFEDAGVGDEEHPFFFWVYYHDGESDLSWTCATLAEAVDDGRQALDEAWDRYVAEGGAS